MQLFYFKRSSGHNFAAISVQPNPEILSSIKYQVGDKILILHSNEEAIVVDIINDQMLLVDVQGVQFPVYMDQVDFPYFKQFSEKKMFPIKKEKQYVDDLRKEKAKPEPRKNEGVFLTFLPVMKLDEAGHEIVEELKLHIENRTSDSYAFHYTLHFFGRPDFSFKNKLNPFEQFYLHDIVFADLNDSPSFEFEFSLTEPDPEKAEKFATTIKLKPKQLFTKIRELQEKNLATFSQVLFDVYPGKMHEHKVELGDKARHKGRLYEAGQAKQHIEQAQSVIDLHIEKLSNDWHRMSNFEILTLQLKTFEKCFHLSLVHHQPSLIVIHGVGEGKLRDEIHEWLRGKTEVKYFSNQFHPRYGFGATEIYFQY